MCKSFILQIVREVKQPGAAAQAIVPVKKMRVIVILTVIVKADWFVGLIIVHPIFLMWGTIVVEQVCLYIY